MSGAWCRAEKGRVYAITNDAHANRSAGWTEDQYADSTFVEGASPGGYDQDEFTRRFGIGGGRASPPPVGSLLVTPRQLAELKQPRVVRIVNAGTPLTMDAAGVLYSRDPVIRSQETVDGTVVARYERGTGPGNMTIMPPELKPVNLYGHKGRSGTNDVAACPDPSLVSDSSLTLWSDELEGGATRGIFIASGVKAPGTVSPANGWAIKREAVAGAGRMALFNTDADGAEDYTKPIRIGEYTIPTADGSAGQALITDGDGVAAWQDVGGGGGGDADTYNAISLSEGDNNIATVAMASRIRLSGHSGGSNVALISNAGRKTVALFNAGAHTIIIRDNNSDAGGVNRAIVTGTGDDFTLAVGTGVMVVLDETDNVWRLIW
jgi:hypothetical protein